MMRALAVLAATLVFGGGTACGQGVLTCCYLEERGDEQHRFVWSLEDRQLTSRSAAERHHSEFDGELATWLWRLENSSAGSEVEVERCGDELHFRGTWEGAPSCRSVSIDDAPWFQALSLSLRVLLDDSERVRFWTVRPDTLDVMAMQARRIGEEPLATDAGEVAAVRVEVRAAGWRSMLWKGDYWFRAEDGVFLRFEAVNGPPGTARTTVRLAPEACRQP